MLAVTCAALLVVPVAAGTQTTPTPITVSSFSSIPMSGKASNGKTLTGNFNASQFLKAYALGTLTGRLHIDLNQVVLNITGVTRPGQLLGNLLCGPANLPNPGLPAGQLAGLLNIIQQLLQVPGVTGL